MTRSVKWHADLWKDSDYNQLPNAINELPDAMTSLAKDTWHELTQIDISQRFTQVIKDIPHKILIRWDEN